MDAVFLRKHIGECLVTCLGEVAEKRPQDPIEYIGQWLHNYIRDQQYLKQQDEENKRLTKEQEYDNLEKERQGIMDKEAKDLANVDATEQEAAEKQKSRDSKSGSKLETVLEV